MQTSTHEAVVDLLLREQTIDLVVVDQSSAVEDDWPTIKRIRNMSDVAVVALAESASLISRLSALRTGADDALNLPMNLAELLVRTDAVLRRCAALTLERIEIGDIVIDGDQHTVTRSGNPVALTVMEFNLLRTLCRHPRTVLSKSQLLQTVWGFDHYDHNVVEVHMSALRRKLEQHGPRLIHTIRGVGYVLRPELALEAVAV